MSEAEARERLQHAMALHSSGRIDEALAEAGEAVRLDPHCVDAHAYIGNTLVTRKRRFQDGLEALEHAAADSRDPAIWYTLGWCREFVADALARGRGGRHQPVEQDAETLYMGARDAMLHALTLDPPDGLRGDIEDILDVIYSATGVEWEDAAGAQAPAPEAPAAEAPAPEAERPAE